MGRGNNHPTTRRTKQEKQQETRTHKEHNRPQTKKGKQKTTKSQRKARETKGGGQEEHRTKATKEKHNKESSTKFRPTSAKPRCSPPSCTKEASSTPEYTSKMLVHDVEGPMQLHHLAIIQGNKKTVPGRSSHNNLSPPGKGQRPSTSQGKQELYSKHPMRRGGLKARPESGEQRTENQLYRERRVHTSDDELSASTTPRALSANGSLGEGNSETHTTTFQRGGSTLNKESNRKQEFNPRSRTPSETCSQEEP